MIRILVRNPAGHSQLLLKESRVGNKVVILEPFLNFVGLNRLQPAQALGDAILEKEITGY